MYTYILYRILVLTASSYFWLLLGMAFISQSGGIEGFVLGCTFNPHASGIAFFVVGEDVVLDFTDFHIPRRYEEGRLCV